VKVFLLFLDGVGIGPADPERNPFFVARLPVLRSLLGDLPHLRDRRRETSDASLHPVDANLRMPGLPQSGTGQTAIFTGVNGARHFGRHFGPYPPTSLRPIIAERSLFRRVRDVGKRAVLANAFPQRFFDYTASGTRRLNVPTMASLAAEIPLKNADDLAADRAVSADFVRDRWKEMGHANVEPVTPEVAGTHAARIIADHDLTVFDYWITDHVGHAQDMPRAVVALERLDAFLGGLLETIDLRSTLLIAISDHGNIEDLSTKMHTRNPVPCLALGPGHRRCADRIRNLTHVAPCVLEHLNITP
jgi:hypothetical protein